ncbi:MAG: peroxiredoxin [Myxococcota bacterium]
MYTLIQKPAPDFRAEAVLPSGEFGEVELASFKDNKYVLLFFYPLDFTFVCPSEIIAFSNQAEAFEQRNVQIIGVSVDSKYSHHAWRQTPVQNGGVGKVKFPLVADITKEISRDYGVLIDESVALRATFLIDKEGIVRHATLNDLPLGRNVQESLRIVDALQFTEKNGEVCPAGWTTGKAGMQPTPEGVAQYLQQHSEDLS